jgi:hypothetical protein
VDGHQQLSLLEDLEDDDLTWAEWFEALLKVPPPVGRGPLDTPLEEAA